MPKSKKPKVRRIRATKGAERANGEAKPILSLRTQYAVDRFGSYVQSWMREGQKVGIKKGLPKLAALRKHIGATQGKDSQDYKLVDETITRYIKLYREIRAGHKKPPRYDPDMEGVRYG